jgi:thiamine pyrophosphokinase
MPGLRILIVANGAKPAEAMLHHHAERSDVLIAADGGATVCLHVGLKPDVIIGDMDSFRAQPEFGELNIIVDTDQETNDLEKALKHAKMLGASRITILGATGIRLDQTLKNISVMQQFHGIFDELIFRDELCWMRILPPEFSFNVSPGTVISLFPISGVVGGITTTGLKYALNNESLENGVRDGSSNESISDSVSVSHKSGSLLLMVFDTLIE